MTTIIFVLLPAISVYFSGDEAELHVSVELKSSLAIKTGPVLVMKREN